ncbi:MAG: glycoside hydrolase family 10 protein [Microcoleaceae cyanobacterium]
MNIRGVWVTSTDSRVLYSRQTIVEAMQFLAQTGFNTVFPVVWGRGVTLYPSQIMQQNFGIEIDFYMKGRDPLQELIEAAHQVGLKVIPWFEYGFACSYRKNGGRILQQKPEWSALDQQGKLLTKNGFEWMNALDTEVQNFMIDLVLEVVKNYDIEGIQGDDRMPAMPSEGGYNPAIIERYTQETGQRPPLNCKDKRWLQWRADILTQFLGRLFRAVKAAKPHVLISMSPSIYSWGLNEYLQDYIAWIDQDLVDMIHPQLYRRNFWGYKSLVDQLVDVQFKKHQLPKLSPGVLIRVGDYQISPEDLLKGIEYNRFRGVSGEVLFFYEGLRANNNALANALKQGPYAQPV